MALLSTTTTTTTPPRLRSPHHAIPPLLRPVVRAYLLGYASSTAPRLLTLLLTTLTRLHRQRTATTKTPQDPSADDRDAFLPALLRILRGGLELQRFPTFCAALVGGSTVLEIPLRKALERLLGGLGEKGRLRLSRWFSTFIAAWFSLKLLQSKTRTALIDDVPIGTLPRASLVDNIPINTPNTPNSNPHRPIRFAGRTIDLTLFAVTRALDVIVGELWSQRRARRKARRQTWSDLEITLTTLADPFIFSISCALIMWAFVYNPSSLPRSYNKWITSAAAVDPRLITGLNRTRRGEIQYGVDTGQAPLLQSMCADYNLPLSYGDPVQSIPFPCEVVHMGTGPSCEYHALSRLARSFTWSFSTYAPLNLLLSLRGGRRPTPTSVSRALRAAARSSLFLSSFIALFYYGICLGRTRLGPLLLGTSTAARQALDSGSCIASGCALCGWSVLLEHAGRRTELGLFVAPRALATLLPRRYDWALQERETAAFAASVAVVFTCVRERPERVRGVLGRVLEGVWKV